MNRIYQTRKLVIALLLCIAAGSSLAQPSWMRDHEQERLRQRQQAKELRQDEVWAAQRGRAPMQKRETTNQEESRSQNYGAHARNNGRMSPEERRALRRQINEANQSIRYRN